MPPLLNIDWRQVFLPTISPIEIVIRGTLMYLAIFGLLRFTLKREAGELGIADLLVVVLIADAAQNAMAGNYRSLADGLLLVATIIFWSYALDWLGYHVHWVERLIRPHPLLLVKDGRILRRNMRRELITVGELLSLLREQGVSDLSIVKRAYLEGDGRISVTVRDDRDTRAPNRPVH